MSSSSNMFSSSGSESYYSAGSTVELESTGNLSSLERHNVRLLGQGKELLLLSHGFGTNQQVWEGVLGQLDLASKYRVILWDLMGAYSTNPENFDFQRYSSLHSHADDLLEVLEDLEVESVTYVGHSVSGMVGVLASIECPQLFKKLILIGGSCRYLDDPATGYKGGFEVNELDQLFAAMQSNYTVWVSGFAPVVIGEAIDSASVREFSRTLFLIRPDIAFTTLKMVFQSDFRAVLPQVRSEVHLLHTTEDAAVPTPVAEYMHKHIPGSTLEMLPLAGHLPHLTHPKMVADAIDRHARYA